MRKPLLAVVIGISLLLHGVNLATAQANKGRSYSSGSSRSSPSRSSSSGRSYSSGSGSRSFSGGASRSKSPSFGSSPSSSKGRSYSSGSSRPPSRSTSPSSKPPTGLFDRSAGSAQRKEESRKTFDSRRPASTPTLPPSWPGTANPSPRGRSYSSPTPSNNGAPRGKSYSTGAKTAPAPPSPFSGSSYDKEAASAQRRAESKTAYTKGQTPQPEYIDRTGRTRPIDTSDRRVEDLRRQLDHERWVNRESRKRQFFEPYYSRPAVTYQDPYSSFFWWWLLSQRLDTQARWAYHHRHSMDDTRYRELLARNAQLEGRIRELEAKEGKPNPTYVPEGLEPDLMYADEYVDAVYNPQPQPAARPAAGSRISVTILKTLLIVGIAAFVIWLVFIKRWGGTPY